MVRGIMFAMIVSAAAVAQPPPLTLDDAVKLALQRNSDLQRQILLTLSAEQDRVIARSAVLPRLDFNASVGRTRQGAGDVVVSGVSFPQSASNFSSATHAQVEKSRSRETRQPRPTSAGSQRRVRRWMAFQGFSVR